MSKEYKNSQEACYFLLFNLVDADGSGTIEKKKNLNIIWKEFKDKIQEQLKEYLKV